MSQRIVVMCDVHQARDEDAPGRPYEVAVGGRTIVVDLCDACAKPLVDLFGELLEVGREESAPARRGRRPAPPTATATGAAGAGEVCPICHRRYQHRGSLRSHLRGVHDTTYATATGTATEFVCAVCGDAFSSAAALGVHTKTHRATPGGEPRGGVPVDR
jgi:hypothetical protein